MRYGAFVVALTALFAFAAVPALACEQHTKTSQMSTPSTVAQTTIQQSKPANGG